MVGLVRFRTNRCSRGAVAAPRTAAAPVVASCGITIEKLVGRGG